MKCDDLVHVVMMSDYWHTVSSTTVPVTDRYASPYCLAVAEMGDRLATVDMGRKVGADVPLAVGGAGSP